MKHRNRNGLLLSVLMQAMVAAVIMGAICPITLISQAPQRSAAWPTTTCPQPSCRFDGAGIGTVLPGRNEDGASL